MSFCTCIFLYLVQLAGHQAVGLVSVLVAPWKGIFPVFPPIVCYPVRLGVGCCWARREDISSFPWTPCWRKSPSRWISHPGVGCWKSSFPLHLQHPDISWNMLDAVCSTNSTWTSPLARQGIDGEPSPGTNRDRQRRDSVSLRFLSLSTFLGGTGGEMEGVWAISGFTPGSLLSIPLGGAWDHPRVHPM